MVEILQNKNSSTRFQILVEIAASGPTVHQRSIAARLGITPQAVSDYVRQLMDEGMVVSAEHSGYRVSIKGVNWIIRILRELNDYVSLVNKAITNLTICAAIAEHDLAQGQTVGLKMQDGLLFAVDPPGTGAKGVTVSSVRKGEDVDISNIEGLVDLTRGKVIVLQVPSVSKGGSRKVDLNELSDNIGGSLQIGAIGIEALAALRKTNIEPRYLYGVAEAAVEAVRCGLSFIVVCADDAISNLIKKLREEEINYEIKDLTLKTE